MSANNNDAGKPTAESIQKIFAPIHQHFLELYSDLEKRGSYTVKSPLLAHYTSIEVLERVLATNQVWFSNPLFMDDLEELRFGITEGYQQFQNNQDVRRASGSDERASKLFDAFNYYYNQFANEHAIDVYVLCLSEHTRGNSDGLLSMWRGYGGNGKGAAVVFDTAKFGANPNSPLVIAQVTYESTAARREWLTQKIAQFATLLSTANLPDDRLHWAAWLMFQRIKAFALFTKHSGFFEEQEWRIVYFKERDVANKVLPMLGYAIGNRGVEPKLKLELVPVEGVTPPDLSLGNIVHQIILGPSISSELVKAAVLRMLDKLGHQDLKNRVIPSSIPFRKLS